MARAINFRVTAPDLSGFAGEVKRASAVAVTAGVTGAARGLLVDMRAKVGSAGLGSRLPNALGMEVYPKGRASLKATGSITARGKQADMLFDVFIRGATIKPSHGKFLMIPTEAAKRSGLLGVMRLGEGTKAGTSRSLDLRYAGRALGLGNREVLHFIPPGPGRKNGYLVARGVVAAKGSRGGFRAATPGRLKQHRQLQDVLLAVLVPQVTLKSRLDFEDLAEQWGDRVAELIEQAMEG